MQNGDENGGKALWLDLVRLFLPSLRQLLCQAIKRCGEEAGSARGSRFSSSVTSMNVLDVFTGSQLLRTGRPSTRLLFCSLSLSLSLSFV